MLAFERELDGHPAQVVLVVDDMTATMSCSIVAKKRGLKVAHVIAGTRSFDMNMPREVNRTIVDAISDYLFTAGMVANRNLNQEGMIPEYIHYVGNILIDTIRFNRHRLVQPMWFSSLGLRKARTTCCSPSTAATCWRRKPYCTPCSRPSSRRPAACLSSPRYTPTCKRR